MTTQNYCYWLQGFFEISGEEKLTANQIKIIKNHLNLVKKCWEPKQEDKPNFPIEDFAMDLLPEDLDIPAMNSQTPSGEVLLTC